MFKTISTPCCTCTLSPRCFTKSNKNLTVCVVEWGDVEAINIRKFKNEGKKSLTGQTFFCHKRTTQSESDSNTENSNNESSVVVENANEDDEAKENEALVTVVTVCVVDVRDNHPERYKIDPSFDHDEDNTSPKKTRKKGGGKGDCSM
jgi:hypothetical protein